jgi:16S rRNA G966 N2-methylase RsmD
MIDENNLNQVMNVVKADVRDYVRRCEQTYDLIFMDPPYEISFYDDLIALIFERNLLKKEEGLLVVEHGKKTDFSDHPNFERVKNYGNVNFSFFNA